MEKMRWLVVFPFVLGLLTFASCTRTAPLPAPTPEPSHKVWTVKMFGREIIRSETNKDEQNKEPVK